MLPAPASPSRGAGALRRGEDQDHAAGQGQPADDEGGGGDGGRGDGLAAELLALGVAEVARVAGAVVALRLLRHGDAPEAGAEAEARGIDLKFADAQQKQENQIKAIRGFIAQGVDAILVAPVVATGWEEVLTEAKEANIPVVLLYPGERKDTTALSFMGELDADRDYRPRIYP